jgi:hypothetical protein
VPRGREVGSDGNGPLRRLEQKQQAVRTSDFGVQSRDGEFEASKFKIRIRTRG